MGFLDGRAVGYGTCSMVLDWLGRWGGSVKGVLIVMVGV